MRAKRLLRIARISQTNERLAAQLLGASQIEIDRYRAQLMELARYREEYRALLRDGTAKLMSGFEAQKLKAFIYQIDGAINSLEGKIAQSTARYDMERKNWIDHLRRSKTMHEVAEKARVVERSADDIREQREIDDLAATTRAALNR